MILARNDESRPAKGWYGELGEIHTFVENTPDYFHFV
jgi:hypothetical protein